MQGIALRAEATGIRPSCSFTSFRRAGNGHGASFWKQAIAIPPSPRVKRIRRQHNAPFKRSICDESAFLRLSSSPPNRTTDFSPSVDEILAAPPTSSLTTNTSFAPAWDELLYAQSRSHPSEDDALPPPPPPSKDEIRSLLRTRNPERLLEILTKHPSRTGLIASLPRTTFLETLRILDPAYFLQGHKIAERFTPPTQGDGDGRIRRLPLETIFKSFITALNGIIFARKENGQTLGIIEYTYLLNCARLTGDYKLATMAWSGMESDGVTPDATCYNHLMEAKCWSRAYLWEEREHLRVIPYTYKQRLSAVGQRQAGFKGHGTGPGGLKIIVTNHFRQMVAQGEPGDESTFTILMTAMAREGDLDGVKNILLDAWNINVGAILSLDGGLSGTSDPSLVPKQYDRGSPLYPSPRLLFVIAHVFCINNEMATALRLVDFVSRHYAIPITWDVWEHLLEWTYVLSIPRYGLRRTDGASTGQLPRPLLNQLWDTMTGEPYNVEPTMSMYHFLIRYMAVRQIYHKMMDTMRKALPLHYRSQKIFLEALHEYSAECEAMNGKVSPSTLRRTELAAAENRRDTRMVKRWVGLLLANTRFPNRQDSEWQRRVFQNAIVEWAPWLPQEVSCKNTQFEVVLQRRQVRAFAGIADVLKRPSFLTTAEAESTIFTIGESLRASPDEEFL